MKNSITFERCPMGWGFTTNKPLAIRVAVHVPLQRKDRISELERISDYFNEKGFCVDVGWSDSIVSITKYP